MRGRRRDFTLRKCASRQSQATAAVIGTARRRASAGANAVAASPAHLGCAIAHHMRMNVALTLALCKSNRISTAQFSFNFNMFSDAECLSLFRFTKRDISRVIIALAWPENQNHTKKNRYAVTPLLTTCIVLRRLSSSSRWTDMEIMFGKYAAQLSEIFWESLEHFMKRRECLLSSVSLIGHYMSPRARIYANAIREKGGALRNCVGFIDGSVIGVACPGDNTAQSVAYNGHKRKHDLKFQAITAPDGMIVHAFGPLEGRRHDWTLYVKSELDEMLPYVLNYGKEKFCLFGDSGYHERWYLIVPFTGTSMNPPQQLFNKSMSSVRISIEWIFKEIKLYFSTIDIKRTFRVGESSVGMLYKAAMLVTNIRNAIYPNQVAQFFQCEPLSLEEYLLFSDE